MKTDYTISLNNIPCGWGKCRFKNIYSFSKEIVGNRIDEYERLALTLNGVIKRPKNDQNGLQPKDLNNYQIIKKSDMVFKMIDLQNISTSRVGLSKWDGIVSPVYLRFSPKYDDPGFMYYYFMSLYYNNVFNNIAGNGVRSALNSEDIGNIFCPFPSLKVQNRIAKELDKKCFAIDKLTANLELEIKKIEAYKKAVITKAVTKGLDANVKMKDSGIVWINKIPEHWEIKRVKYVCNSLLKGNGIAKDDVKDDGDIQCVRYGEIYSKYCFSFEKTYSRTNLSRIPMAKHIFYGDILFAGTGELVEEIGKNILYKGNMPCLAGGDIIIMKHSQNPTFLNYVLGSYYSQEQKSSGKAKLKVVHISSEDIGNIYIALPPFEEQQIIADFLDNKCSKIDEIIKRKNKELEILEKYKKSLIYEYVTGKNGRDYSICQKI